MVLINIPVPITIKLTASNGQEISQEISMAKFIKDILGSDRRAGADLKTLLSAQEVIKTFDDAEKANVTPVKIHANDFDIIKPIILAPQGGYLPVFALQVLPYIEAIRDGQRE